DYAASCSFLSFTAATTLADLVGISLGVRTNFATGACSTDASVDKASSRVGKVASTSISSAPYNFPPTDKAVTSSALCSLAKFLKRRAAAPGSSCENAKIVGPTNASLRH